MIKFTMRKDTVHPAINMVEGVTAWVEGRAENNLHQLSADEAMAISLAGIHNILSMIAYKMGIDLEPSFPLDKTFDDAV